MSGLCIALAILCVILAASLASSVSQLRKERLRFNSLNRQYHTIYQRFKNIIDVEEAHAHLSKLFNVERARAKGTMLDLKQKHDQMLKAHEHNKKQLQDETERIVHAMDALQAELDDLTEIAQRHDIGFYKPRYIFDTSEAYKRKLDEIRDHQALLIKEHKAVLSHTETSSAPYQLDIKTSLTKLVLRAFNGACDAAVASVDARNIVVMERRINKTFETINLLSRVQHIEITHEYLRLKLNELYLTYEFHTKREEEKEEQRKIREQINEEDNIQRELERAISHAERESKRLEAALAEAHTAMEEATEKELNAMYDEVERLQTQLHQAQVEKKQTEFRLNQFTSGHVYILSNIGSFGESVFKIGMTRRLNPIEYIKHLGDTSVPFHFDIHALIYSDNATDLVKDLHRRLALKRINLINSSSEFYQVSIEEIEHVLQEHFKDIEISRHPDAQEYRHSKAMKEEASIQTGDVWQQPEDKEPARQEVKIPEVFMEWVQN